MKTLPPSFTRQSGFTLIEVMISSAVVGVTGIILYYVLLTGLTLFTKNTAINMAHQEARSAVVHMEQNIHQAISIPRLTTTNPVSYVAGSGPAVGIAFQEYNSGPYEVTPSATAITGMPAGTSATGYNANATQITIRCTGGFVPTQELRLVIPDYQIEATVNTAASAGSGTNSSGINYTDYNITLMDDSQSPTNGSPPYLYPSYPLPFAVRTSYTGASGSATQNYNVACFFTNRVAYVVNGSQLLYYSNPQLSNTYKVLANSITSATPFSIPSTPLGAQFSRFVAAVNMVTADSQTTNLQFKAANMFLNSMEPYRARLCTYQ
jgi:prepilin-type N-terminal cleavage/methylation domain-containing protein